MTSSAPPVTHGGVTGWSAHPAADLFPLLPPEELRQLADDIKANGLLEPVWLYDDPDGGWMLLDGRNRAAACEVAGVPVATRTYTGDDPIGFALSLNLKRRHLTPGQRDFLALEVEKLYAAAVKPGRPPKAETTADLQEIPPRYERQSATRAAAATGASGRGVAQAKRVQQQAPDLADKVRGGTMAIDRAERIIRDREAEQRRINQARADAAAVPMQMLVDIRHGDFRDVLTDLHDVDAVITDPPYPAEFLPLLPDLALWADKVLKPDGVLAVLVGQTHLPDVYRLLSGHRPYRWTACYLAEGPAYVSHPRRVASNWKPVLIYGGGPRFGDIIRTEGTGADARSNHKWGQDYNAFHTLVERLTSREDLVVDPFMGSGTTLLAAHALGRHTTGCDIDLAAVDRARERLA